MALLRIHWKQSLLQNWPPPKVAQQQSCVWEQVKEAVALLRKQRPELLVEGPIQYDAAVDPEVARVKIKVGMLPLQNCRQYGLYAGPVAQVQRVSLPASGPSPACCRRCWWCPAVDARPYTGGVPPLAAGRAHRAIPSELLWQCSAQFATKHAADVCSFMPGSRSGADSCTFLLLGETCTRLSLLPIDVFAQGASEVAGRANVLIFPDLNTGNNTYKVWHRVPHTGTVWFCGGTYQRRPLCGCGITGHSIQLRHSCRE